jgi:hypothetical protein
MIRVIFRRLPLPVLLSSIVAICFGYADAPLPTAIGWGLACALWWAQPSLVYALTDATWVEPRWYKVTLMTAMMAIATSAFVVGDCLSYFLARTASN